MAGAPTTFTAELIHASKMIIPLNTSKIVDIKVERVVDPEDIKMYDEFENIIIKKSIQFIPDNDVLCIWNDLRAGDMFIDTINISQSATPRTRIPKLVTKSKDIEGQ